MKEFVYYDKYDLNIPLGDEIDFIRDLKNDTYIVSNTPEIKSQMVASEVDFYLKNSLDSIIEKAKNVSLLYEARVLGFDGAKDMDFFQEVGKNIILVGEFDNLEETLKAEGFGVLSFKTEQIEDINGHLGALEVDINLYDKKINVSTDQIVWKNAPDFALKQSGVIDAKEQNIDDIVSQVVEKLGDYKYKNYITYNNSICQYHERREEICGKCAEVCPTVAITKIDEEKHLKFSHIDCHGCGGCVSVCPSGALDYSQMPQDTFFEISKLYRGKIPLIIPRKMFNSLPDIELPKGVLPFGIEGEKYLHEAHLITLLQDSGSQIIFYTDFVSKGTKDVVNILNQIYNAKFGKNAILVCMNKDELKNALQNSTNIKYSNYDIFANNLPKREVFAKRLEWLVGEDDLGVVKTGEHVRYGDVKVKEENCTLCLSCVDACNVGALSIDTKINSLNLNPSICTTCGYCEATCPEKDCLKVIRGEIPLKSSWFTKRVLAQDTLFECIVCHKPFATTKSILKIAGIMKPIFAGDEAKIKSLYCCADCKPKVLFEEYLKTRVN